MVNPEYYGVNTDVKLAHRMIYLGNVIWISLR